MTWYLGGAKFRQFGLTCVAVAVAVWAASAQQAQAGVMDTYASWQMLSESELAETRGGFFTGSEAFDFRVAYNASLDGFDLRTELSYAEKTFTVTVGELNGASLVRDEYGNLSLINVPAGIMSAIVEVTPGQYEVSIGTDLVAELRDGGPEDLELTVLLPVPASLKVDANGIELDIRGEDQLEILSSLSRRRVSNIVANPLPTFATLATTLDIRLGAELTSLLSTMPPFLRRLTAQSNSLY